MPLGECFSALSTSLSSHTSIIVCGLCRKRFDTPALCALPFVVWIDWTWTKNAQLFKGSAVSLGWRPWNAEVYFLFSGLSMRKHLLSLVLWVTAHVIQEAFHKPASQLDTTTTSSRVQVQVQVHNSTTSSFTLLYLLISTTNLQVLFQLFSTVLLQVTVTGIQHGADLL